MARKSMKNETQPADKPAKKQFNKGSWTTEEDRKLAEVVGIHGAKRWTIVAAKAGLNRCGKSCRLRWLNYLRPNIKRGNISDQEEDLILRLHKLLGNRWALIAGRLPGRTDNEIKNYWNSHLSKKINQKEKNIGASSQESSKDEKETIVKINAVEIASEENNNSNNSNNNNSSSSGGEEEDSNGSFNVDDFFDFSNEDPLNLEWMNHFLEFDASFSAWS